MVWIRTISEAEATGQLKDTYVEMLSRTDATTVLDSRKAMSLHPGVLQAADGLSRQVSKGASGLSNYREELIALLVSERLNCELWIVGHGAALRAIAGDTLAVRVKRNYREAGLPEPEVAMLAYAEKLTLDPGSIAQDDIQQLRDHGFSDEDILAICTVTAYHNFNVRMADGLGVKLENRYDHVEADFRNALLDKG